MLKCLLPSVLFIIPLLVSAEPSRYVGKWCSNPCYYGSSSRPWDLPCAFEITNDEIRWEHKTDWDKTDLQQFVVKYTMTAQQGEVDTLLVTGGESVWYDQAPSDKQYLLKIGVNSEGPFWKGKMALVDYRKCDKGDGWCEAGGMVIRPLEGSCP